MKTVRDRLEWLKEKKRLSDRNIADDFHISVSAVQGWRYENKIPAKHVDKLCKYFGVKKEWLLDGLGEVWDFSVKEESFNEDKINMAIRFHKEIARLKLIIPEISAILNCSQEDVEYMILGYKEINALYLANLVKHGFDINYILAGIKSEPLLTANQETNIDNTKQNVNNNYGNLTQKISNKKNQ